MGAIVLCLFLFSCLMLCRSFFRRNLTYRTDPKMSARKRSRVRRAPTGAANSNGSVVSNDINLTLIEIMMALTRPDIIMLGLYYGSNNIKTSDVVERITKRVKKDNLFDLIARASVTKKPDLKRIQGELGTTLGLQLKEKTLEGRARLLCDKIKMTTKILIILDDVRGEINLGKIGIPFGSDHNGCKILLISETQDVLLSNQTNAQIQFVV